METNSHKNNWQRMALRIRLTDPVRFTGPATEMEWKGSIAVDKGPGGQTVTGKLRAEEGRFDLLGNRFKIETGEVTLPEGELTIDPFLVVVAASDTPVARVKVTIRGRASRPQMIFSSEPPMAQPQLLTLLLTGSADANEADSQRVLAEAATLLVIAENPALANFVTRSTGLDYVGVSFGETTDQPILTVGKHIAQEDLRGDLVQAQRAAADQPRRGARRSTSWRRTGRSRRSSATRRSAGSTCSGERSSAGRRGARAQRGATRAARPGARTAARRRRGCERRARGAVGAPAPRRRAGRVCSVGRASSAAVAQAGAVNPMHGETMQRHTSTWIVVADAERARILYLERTHSFSNHNTPPVREWITLPDNKPINPAKSIDSTVKTDNTINIEYVQVVTDDNITLDAWINKPKNFDPAKKYPVVFYVYGEPAASTVLDRYGNQNNFLYNGDIRADGYVQVGIDNRGTPMLKGAAWRKSIYRKIGDVNVRDMAMGFKKLMEQNNYFDRERIAVWGWSGGGSATLHLMFRHGDIFKTGISIAAVWC